jgi:hypothetical protein
MVSPIEVASGASPILVLRFTSSDGVVLDLEQWPDDWDRYAPAQLVELARQARPARTEASEDQSPRAAEDRSI